MDSNDPETHKKFPNKLKKLAYAPEHGSDSQRDDNGRLAHEIDAEFRLYGQRNIDKVITLQAVDVHKDYDRLNQEDFRDLRRMLDDYRDEVQNIAKHVAEAYEEVDEGQEYD